jgi:hypothetical protein
MSRQDTRISELMAEATAGRWNRRTLLARAAALGVVLPLAGAVRGVSAEDATPVMDADGKIQVGILNKAMSMDEIKAEVAKEGSVNVGNWTYTANDTLIAKFQ